MSAIVRVRPGTVQDSPTGSPATLNFRMKGRYVEDVKEQERATGPPAKMEGELNINPYSRNEVKEAVGKALGEESER